MTKYSRSYENVKLTNPANELKDFMWNFVKDGQQEANAEELQELVYSLIQMMTQKTAGQRDDKPNHIDFNRLEMLTWQIVIEATCLVLDKRFPQVKELLKDDES